MQSDALHIRDALQRARKHVRPPPVRRHAMRPGNAHAQQPVQPRERLGRVVAHRAHIHRTAVRREENFIQRVESFRRHQLARSAAIRSSKEASELPANKRGIMDSLARARQRSLSPKQ